MAFFGILLLAVPSVAFADIGAPMIIPSLLGMTIMLIPIIILETWICKRMLDAPLRRMASVAVAGNMASTFVGIPITWILLLFLEIVTDGGGRAGGSMGLDIDTLAGKIYAVTGQAPWLLPYEDKMYWMLPAAMLVLLVPFFFATWFVEYQIARRMLKELSAPNVKRAVLMANLASYGLLAFILIVDLGAEVYLNRNAWQ